jgi:predicted MFS family arabinose efflux permease
MTSALRQLFQRRSGGGDSLLHLPGVRPLVAAQLFSSVGTSMALLAVAYLSFTSANSLLHTVLVATAYSLPAAFVGGWSGRLADSHDHRKVVLATSAVSIVIWIGVTGLQVAGWLNPWWLTLSQFVAGFAGAVQYPSWQELERQLVPSDRLQEANALFSSAGSTARIFGAVVGGVLITWVGAGWVFLFNALTYIPMMAVIARLPPSLPRDRRGAKRVRLVDALRYARKEPAVLLSLRLVIILTLLAVPIAKMLPAVADELGGEAHNLGILTAFYSLGGALVAAVLHRMTKHRSKSALVAPAVLACGISLLIIGLLGDQLGGAGRQVAVLALLVPIGLGLAMAQAVLSATVQVSASAEMEGEVIALYGAVVSIVTPIGGFALAGVADATTVWLAIAIAGGGLAIISIGMFVVTPLELTTIDPDSAVGAAQHDAAMDHGRHLGAQPAGFIHPGQFHPLTVGRRRRSSRVGSAP